MLHFDFDTFGVVAEGAVEDGVDSGFGFSDLLLSTALFRHLFFN